MKYQGIYIICDRCGTDMFARTTDGFHTLENNEEYKEWTYNTYLGDLCQNAQKSLMIF